MNRLKQLREEKGMNMHQAAKALGFVYQTYVNWEKGNRRPQQEALVHIAKYYETTVDYIIGASSSRYTDTPKNIIPIPPSKAIPLLGDIACGRPILAEENIDTFINAYSDIPADFALRCKGDSMINSRIYDGDIVYIRQQPIIEDGEIAAVLIDDEATLKEVHRYGDKIVLRASNPIYKDIVITSEDTKSIRIIGKAVAFISTIK